VWKWIHKFGSPRSFYEISEKYLPWLSGMDMHVPASILAQSSYMMMATAAAIFLIWRIKLADVAVQAMAPIGASITFLALISGSIWGKPMWGTWWVWDARLTSTLVLFFLFVGIMALRSAMENRDSAGRATAILAVIGVINLPIIKFSVDWWNTLHQPASFTLTEKPAMPAEMWLPLLVMVIGFYLFFFTVLVMRMQAEILSREHRSEWVSQRVKHLLVSESNAI
jgi:heme exporter protein C